MTISRRRFIQGLSLGGLTFTFAHLEVAAAWVATHMRKPKRATTGGSVGDPGISSHAVAAAPIGGEPSAVN